MVGAQCQLDTRFLHYRRTGNGEVLHLRLASVAQDRTGNHRSILLRQNVRDQVSLCAVNNHIVQIELLGNANGSADVVCPVAVEVCFHISFQQGQQCFGFGIVVRHVFVGIALRKVQFLLIPLCFRQPLPYHCRCRHAGDRRFVPVVVDALGILAKGKFHTGADLHAVCHTSCCFQDRHGAAAGVGTAGRSHHRSHAGCTCFGKTVIQRVYAVNDTQMRGKRIGGFVAVVPLESNAVFDNAEVGVCIDKARQQHRTAGINILRRQFRRLAGLHGGDLAVFYADIAVFQNAGICHRMYGRVPDFHVRSSFRFRGFGMERL